MHSDHCFFTAYHNYKELRNVFSVTDSLHEIEPQELRPDVLTVGIVTCEELTEFGPGLGFDEDTIEASQKANHLFRTGLDVRNDYTFAELRKESGSDFSSEPPSEMHRCSELLHAHVLCQLAGLFKDRPQ